MQNIVVYGKPHCSQCNMVKAKLNQKNKEYTYIDIEKDTMTKAQELQAEGKLIETMLPIIMLGNEQISHRQLNTI